MKKEFVWGTIVAALFGAALLVVMLLASNKEQPTTFEQYKEYAQQVNVVDWTISEDTAESFADANCNKLEQGEMPAIAFQNGEHVKSSGAVIAAYCPESFDNFLAGIAMKYPEYIETAKYLNYRIKVY
ncbi:hypothetical protein SEA_ANNADREAMY_212 [Streptomyces phage Annadreamy]|uniref:Uncharacterized protein n=2 Tax=Annadreamyvirus annadreamy TaxID=2846392 RepID=A0A345GTM5_9CAUD|nr:hypothetical protein HWB75_gp066 [Streptomyces phage Annadreamy]AXG66297.1 hypothetical protein SEA_ANNADREAMY_212 [Streptomyces phage Annadreamy]QGH79520.1 hypothetical protein SEA_LIMPID_219 [Streptomyces phage Limpid]